MISLATLATEFLNQSGLSVSTVRSYTSTLMPLVRELGRTPVELLNRQLIEGYLNSLNHLAYTTQNRHKAVIVTLMNFGVERGYLKMNPVGRIRQRKPDASKGEHGTDQIIRYLTPIQLETLYEAVTPDVRLHAVVKLLHQTGARVGEILALDLEDVDLERCRFQVVGKGNKRRWCFYGQEASLILDKYLRYYRDKEINALFTAKKPFSKIVSRLSYARLYESFQSAISERAILKRVRLHDLRHTYATERVQLVSLEELRALMGHENIQTTLRYQKVTSFKAEEAAKKALKILQESGKTLL
jgi:integrase/recombinase XerD